ncbi:MAG: hypothetical protein ACE5RN_08175 [Nitrosopumilaceae archaeon]
MKKAILVIFLIFTLFPISSSFSQELVDKKPTLGISLTSFSPFNYKNSDGKTVILGEVQNTKNFPVTGVKIWAGFYDNASEKPLETKIGTTIMEVIPPFGKSPYMIISDSSNPAINSVSVNLLGFNSSPDKKQQLKLTLDTLKIGEKLSLSGKITNNGKLNSTNTKIQLISYDAFNPPRVLGISTVNLVTDIVPGGSENFEFDVKRDARSSAFKIVAESKDFSSGLLEITDTSIQVQNKLITIDDIAVTDPQGNRLSDVSVGSSINIQSKLSFEDLSLKESDAQEYVYWIQIKKSVEINGETKSFVEFIGNAEGTMDSEGGEIPSVGWIPENDGLYFVETFVWDPKYNPLASNGPISLILVK